MPESPLKPPTAPIDEERDMPPVLHGGADLLPGYAELHCMTSFSFQRGASHAQELVRRAYNLGYQALGGDFFDPRVFAISICFSAASSTLAIRGSLRLRAACKAGAACASSSRPRAWAMR